MTIKKRTFRSVNPGWDSDDAANDRRILDIVGFGTVSATATRTLFIPRTEVLIKKISFTIDATISTPASNYYTIAIQNASKSNASLISGGTFSTATGGVLRTAYDLGVDQNLYLAPGDIIVAILTLTGTALLTTLQMFVEYENTGYTTTVT